MSASTGASSNSHSTEEIGEYEHSETFDFPNYELQAEDSGESEYPRWRRVPRSPSDFIESKSTITSCKDSDYERWLEDYYNELLAQTMPSFTDRQVDTFDLMAESPPNVVKSAFSTFQKDLWTGSTKYWGPKEVRRHWQLHNKQKEYLLFPTIYPNLNLRSRYGRFHSLLYTAAAVPEFQHRRLVCHMFKKEIENLFCNDSKLKKMWYCDNLYSIKWFDYMTRTSVIRYLCKFFRTQYLLEKVYFENARLRRMEAIILLCALSRSGGSQIRELHIWQMFDYGQCPLLLNELPTKVSKFAENKSMEFFTKIHYLQILYKFSALTHLSVNYAYLANREGDALLCLKSLRTGSLKELRILCLKDERPFLTNPQYGVGGWSITDGVWRRAVEWCPNLRVKFVFLNMPQYENVILFLSKNIPVSYVYISSGMDFDFETPWDIDSTLLELRNWYAPTLETLCLHLWHHRDLLDFVIKHKILEEFPNLINFEFIGVLEDVETLNSFCFELSKGIYKLKTLIFWVEEQHTNRKKLTATRKRVEEIRKCYEAKFLAVDIDADIKTYALVEVTVKVYYQRVNNSILQKEEKMEGIRLVVSMNQMPPFINYHIDDGSVILEGVLGQLWTTLEERLGFTSEYKKENYTIGISNFRNKKRDVLLHPDVVLSDSSNDFALPITNIWYRIYLRDFGGIKSSNSYITSWSVDLWLCTILLVLLLIGFLYLMLRISDKYFHTSEKVATLPRKESKDFVRYSIENECNSFKNWRKEKNFSRENGSVEEKRKIETDSSLGSCFMSGVAAMSFQGFPLYSEITSIRILIFSFLCYGLVMYHAYSGRLISQLTLGEKRLPFHTLAEIPEKAAMFSLCVRPHSYPFIQMTANDSAIDWKGIINKKPCPGEDKPFSRDLCVRDVAFLESPPVMRERMKTWRCKMAKLSRKYFQTQIYLLIKGGLGKIAETQLTNEMLKFREAGIISRLKSRWFAPEKKPRTDENHIQIAFEHVSGVLFAYSISIGFSFFVFSIELLIYSFPFHFNAKQTLKR